MPLISATKFEFIMKLACITVSLENTATNRPEISCFLVHAGSVKMEHQRGTGATGTYDYAGRPLASTGQPLTRNQFAQDPCSSDTAQRLQFLVRATLWFKRAGGMSEST